MGGAEVGVVEALAYLGPHLVATALPVTGENVSAMLVELATLTP